MKKACLMAAVAAAITLTTGVVMASPATVDFDGFASYRYRVDTTTGAADDKNHILKVVVNAKSEIDPNFSVYARLGVVGTGNFSTGRDSVEASKFAGQVDQYGVVYKNAGFAYKIGRQSATIGATALVYNNNYMIGEDAFVDGVSVKGMSGVTTIEAIAAQEDNSSFDGLDGKLYAVHASYSPAKNWTVGATVGRYDAPKGATVLSTNNYAVDAAYTMGKATIFGEYLKSDADTKNRSYDLGVSYGFDKKNSVYVINYNNEINADMGQKTDFESDYKGFYYGFDHKFDKTTTASLYYKDKESLTTAGKKNTSFRATVNYAF